MLTLLLFDGIAGNDLTMGGLALGLLGLVGFIVKKQSRSLDRRDILAEKRDTRAEEVKDADAKRIDTQQSVLKSIGDGLSETRKESQLAIASMTKERDQAVARIVTRIDEMSSMIHSEHTEILKMLSKMIVSVDTMTTHQAAVAAQLAVVARSLPIIESHPGKGTSHG